MTLPAAMPSTPARASVLVVDPSADSRDVLRMGLQRRGLNIIEATHAEQGLAMMEKHTPHLVVLDVEPEAESTTGDRTAEKQIVDQLAERTETSQTSLLILGQTSTVKAEIPANSDDESDSAASQFFSKPYQYAAVIRKIEELVRQSPN